MDRSMNLLKAKIRDTEKVLPYIVKYKSDFDRTLTRILNESLLNKDQVILNRF